MTPPEGHGRPAEEEAPRDGRLPERDRRASDGKRRLSNAQVGVIAIVLLIVGTYLAFAKEIPFKGHGYTLRATFQNTVNIHPDSPVRIAGVNVGEVRITQCLLSGGIELSQVHDDQRHSEAPEMADHDRIGERIELSDDRLGTGRNESTEA